MRGDILWSEFITAFRAHTIMSCSRPPQVEWRALLTHRGIFIDRSSTRPVAESLIDILYRPYHNGTVSHEDMNLGEYSADHVQVEDNDQ